MWIIQSVLGAFFQAVGMAVKKKALQIRGLNNFIAFFSFTFAGIIIGLVLLFQQGSIFPEIANVAKFWHAIFWAVFLNIFAYFFLYKALDIADLSYLMPFMTLISVTVIIPPIFLLGEIPSLFGFLGILLVVAGAIIMEYRKKNKPSQITSDEAQKIKNNRKGFVYFIITALCWTFTSPALKIAAVESSAIFSSFIVALFIGLSFFFLVILFKETPKIKKLFSTGGTREKMVLLIALVIAGISIVFEQITINTAFRLADVSYVIAVKRTMPFFAFIIGYFYFKEKNNVRRKLVATALMVAGSMVIINFG